MGERFRLPPKHPTAKPGGLFPRLGRGRQAQRVRGLVEVLGSKGAPFARPMFRKSEALL